MNKFYDNLVQQNRKRPHETGQNGEVITNGKAENGSANTSPMSKRTLLNSQNATNGTKPARMAQKSGTPIQSINLTNAPEEIYYVANKQLK